ncbi:Protein of unknown function [Gryllus bimaculatus]|nr:Protein of unknown function [Gryllus bimaculatus]
MSSNEINISSSKSLNRPKKQCREGKRHRDKRHKREERMLLDEANQKFKKKLVTWICGTENQNETFHSSFSRRKLTNKQKTDESTEDLQEYTDDDEDLRDEQVCIEKKKIQSGQYEERSGKQLKAESAEQPDVDDNPNKMEDIGKSYSAKVHRANKMYTQTKGNEYYIEFVGTYESSANNQFYCHGRLIQGHCTKAQAGTSIKTEEAIQKKKYYETGEDEERSGTYLNLRACSIFAIYVHLFVLLVHLILIAWHMWCLALLN